MVENALDDLDLSEEEQAELNNEAPTNEAETNEAETLFNNPKHQYTKELINLMPKIESII